MICLGSELNIVHREVPAELQKVVSELLKYVLFHVVTFVVLCLAVGRFGNFPKPHSWNFRISFLLSLVFRGF